MHSSGALLLWDPNKHNYYIVNVCIAMKVFGRQVSLGYHKFHRDSKHRKGGSDPCADMDRRLSAQIAGLERRLSQQQHEFEKWLNQMDREIANIATNLRDLSDTVMLLARDKIEMRCGEVSPALSVKVILF